MAPAVAARERQRQLNQHRMLQEQQSNREWENEDLDHRLRAAQGSHDAQAYQILCRGRVDAARREANRRFFRFPQPSELRFVTTAEERADRDRVEDLLTRFLATDQGRDNPEVMMESAHYDASPRGSSYR